MSHRLQDALIALRKIQRRTEQASRRLAATARLTPSQLKVLQLLSEQGPLSAGELCDQTLLKHATITSLLDKLEARKMVARQRSETDRRRVMVELLADGEQAFQNAPDLLQDQFSRGFEELEDWEKGMLVASLERVSKLLNAEDLDAAPVLDVGEINEKPL